MKYSIIIPHLNEWYFLDIMLFSISNNFKYNDFEIIIVDDGSDNLEDLDFINYHPLKEKIKVLYEKELWSPNARNMWAKCASWEFLIFLDSHMYFRDDFLSKLNKILEINKDIEILQPIIWSIKDKKLEGKIYKIKDYLLNSTWDNPIFDSNIIETPNIAWWATIVKKKVFDDLWGFNKFFLKWWAEDLEFSMRLYLYWYKLYLSNDLFVAHYFKESFTNTVISSEQVLNNKIMFLYTCFQNQNRIWLILNELLNYYWDIFYKIHDNILNNLEFWIWLKKEKKKYKLNDDLYFKKLKKYYVSF